MRVGTTKDQGLYNNPSAAVHPGALAAETLLQYNTIQYNTIQYNTIHSLKVLHYRKISTVAEFLLHVWKTNYFLDRVTAYLKQTLMALNNFLQAYFTRPGTGFYVVKIDLVD